MEFEVGKKYTGKNCDGEPFLIEITEKYPKINKYAFKGLKGNRNFLMFAFDEDSDFAKGLKPYEDLPRICRVLGGEDNPLKVREHFKISGYLSVFWIDENGDIVCDSGIDSWGLVAICKAINNPKKLIRSPQFSDDEKALIRLLVKNGLPWIARSGNMDLCAYQSKPKSDGILYLGEENNNFSGLPNKLLPQIAFKNSPFNAKEYLESEAKKDG